MSDKSRETEASVDFPADLSQIATARRFTEKWLGKWDAEALIESATLLVSELVTNAMVHAQTDVELTLRMNNGRFRAEVRDASRLPPRLMRYSRTAATGRGIRIVASQSSSWGTLKEPGGKVVWFELETPTGRRSRGSSAAGRSGSADSQYLRASAGR